MNENLNLVEILKDYPKGTKLYSTVFGEVEFDRIVNDPIYPIITKSKHYGIDKLTIDGKIFDDCGECILFPSKEQRDWSKFKTKKAKFDLKTLRSLDKVLVRNSHNSIWHCDAFTNIRTKEFVVHSYACVTNYYKYCIPYNEETKHLIGSNKQAPEFYRYWED